MPIAIVDHGRLSNYNNKRSSVTTSSLNYDFVELLERFRVGSVVRYNRNAEKTSFIVVDLSVVGIYACC